MATATPRSGVGGKVIAGILAIVVLIGIFAVIKVAGGPEDPAPIAAVTEDEEVEEPTEAEVEEVAEEDTTEEEAPDETVVEEPEPPPAEPVREEPSVEEQLSSIVQERVGPYRLAQAEVSEEFAVNTGATGAIFAGYASRGGGVVFHVVAAYPTPAKANQLLKQAAKSAVRDGSRVVDVGPVNIDRQRTGTWVLLQGKTQTILWTNGVLFSIADGEHPHPIKFFSNIPY